MSVPKSALELLYDIQRIMNTGRNMPWQEQQMINEALVIALIETSWAERETDFAARWKTEALRERERR